jgi:hypothetical protein
MNGLFFSILFIVQAFLQTGILQSSEKAITYAFSGGRFGDNLFAYLHAKWISYLYDIPLFYNPFPYSDQLILDDIEGGCKNNAKAKLEKTKVIRSLEELNKEEPFSTLYILPYFPESLNDRTIDTKLFYIPVDWRDEKFHALVKKLVQPKIPIPTWELPTHCITVAVHIRRGGGWDSPRAQTIDPLRFPSDQFYIDQIRDLYMYFQQSPLYIYLFTDDPFPEVIAKKFQQSLKDLNVCLDYRKQGNKHNANVLEDLFAMVQFECLIRPESNYSIVASIIGSFKVIVHPVQFHWEGKEPIIDQVEKIIHTR